MGYYEEWIAILRAISPLHWNRDDLSIGILTFQPLVTPATVIAEKVELLTETRMERMGDPETAFQLVHKGRSV